MNDTGARQQIVEKIKKSNNILVTVSANPSVDELSAALGLTILLNKMDKHATAVFSGAIPPAITFLDPQKTFENTVDSLRDFIIALNKEKADHLRYKVDGDVVKIFITPYKTTISSEDLEFSQGDYNVELVLALGVKNRDFLDSALAAHGRILHDATVATISVGDEKSELGSVDWRDEKASCLSEMLVGLSDALKTEKPLLDERIATAFLTGLVAATDRFSNNRTSSRVMTMAAQLMSAGANQQLIASKLKESHVIESSHEANNDGTTSLSEDKFTKVNTGEPQVGEVVREDTASDNGSLNIDHESAPTVDAEQAMQPEVGSDADHVEKEQVDSSVDVATNVAYQLAEEQQKETVDIANHQLNSIGSAVPDVTVADLQNDIKKDDMELSEDAQQAPTTSPIVSPNELVAKAIGQQNQPISAPSLGGTLNATTELAEEEKRKAEESERNRMILKHGMGGGSGYVGNSSPIFDSPLNAASQGNDEPDSIDPFSKDISEIQNDSAPNLIAPDIQPISLNANETLEDIEKKNRVPHEEARAAVDSAFGAMSNSGQGIADVNYGSIPPVPPSVMPDFSTLPPLPPVGASYDEDLGPDRLEDVLNSASNDVAINNSSQPVDRSQFRIPGQ